MKTLTILAAVGVALSLAGCGGSADDTTTTELPGMSKAALGAMLFRDTNLSEPAGQSCESCHGTTLLSGDNAAARAFADPNSSVTMPVSEGAVTGVFGDRNAPTAAYAMFAPRFQYDSANSRYIGGQFLDGRAADLAEQAMGPFLNPKEMNNTRQGVVEAVRSAPYARAFKAVYGATSLDDTDTAYGFIADAIATFERTQMFAPFTSKYDAVQAGSATFTASEQRGFDLFRIDSNGSSKAKCAECHKLEKSGGSAGDLFTDFSYWNIGVPQNPNNPAGTAATGFVDIGLAANPNLSTSVAAERGKFKVPTLRNVELTAPYMHNGVFGNLKEVVNFYNVRENPCFDNSTDTGSNGLIACWPNSLPPEVTENVESTFTGGLSLTEQDIDDLIAFMKTLTDGYTP